MPSKVKYQKLDGSPSRGNRRTNPNSPPPPTSSSSSKASVNRSTARIGRILRRLKPNLYQILLKDGDKSNLRLRQLLAFPFGVLCGYIFYKCCITRLDFPPSIEEPLLLPVTLLLYTIAYTLSVQFRTITWLMLPFFAGSLGRSYLYLYFFTVTVNGPTTSLMANSYESGRVVICSFIYHYNVTSDNVQFMFKPYLGLVKGLARGNTRLKTQVHSMERGIQPLKKEIELPQANVTQLKNKINQVDSRVNVPAENRRLKLIEDDFQKNKQFDGSRGKYRAKLAKSADYQCEAVFSQATAKCAEKWAEIKRKCYEELHVVINWLCPLAELTWTCYLMSALLSKRSCDGIKAVPPKFGEGFEQLEMEAQSMESNFNVKQMQYQINVPEQYRNVTSPEAVQDTMDSYFEQKKSLFALVISMLNRLTGVLFLLTLFQANNYHNGYMRKIYHDNKYVTSYFRRIDSRRQEAERMHLLPLRKLEKTELFDAFSLKLTADERRTRTTSLMFFLPIAFGIGILCFFDYAFMHVLRTSRDYFKQSRITVGYHRIVFNVTGTGLWARLLKQIIPGVNLNYTIDSKHSNEQCLPRPEVTDPRRYLDILLYAGLIVFYLLIQGYLTRGRRVICALFYPRREKSRIIFLYNSRLAKRKMYTLYQLKRLREAVVKNAHKEDGPFLTQFIYKYQRFKWLRKFFKRYCAICESAEDENSFLCPKCQVFYCSQCWELCKFACRACNEIPDDGDIGFSDTEGI